MLKIVTLTKIERDKIYTDGKQYIVPKKQIVCSRDEEGNFKEQEDGSLPTMNVFYRIAIENGELVEERVVVEQGSDGEELQVVSIEGLPMWMQLLLRREALIENFKSATLAACTTSFVEEVIKKEFSVLTNGRNLDEWFFFPFDGICPCKLTWVDVDRIGETIRALAMRQIWRDSHGFKDAGNRAASKYQNVLVVLSSCYEHRLVPAGKFIRAALVAQEFPNNPFPDLELPSATASSNLKKISF